MTTPMRTGVNTKFLAQHEARHLSVSEAERRCVNHQITAEDLRGVAELAVGTRSVVVPQWSWRQIPSTPLRLTLWPQQLQQCRKAPVYDHYQS